MNISFKNKVVLITGASKGIGSALAEHFGRLGAHLILTAAHAESLKDLVKWSEKSKLKADCFLLDFTQSQTVDSFLKEIKKYKRIDVCVNNAGINEIDLIEDTRLEAWDALMNVNLKGPFLLTRALTPLMKKNKYGRIINVSSIFGTVTRAKRSIYTTTKSGLLGLTRTTAIELARFNVLVNAVSPGFVWTDLTQRILSKYEVTALTQHIPLGRMAKPQDIANVIVFLASEYNTYIVGQNIIADGGYVNV